MRITTQFLNRKSSSDQGVPPPSSQSRLTASDVRSIVSQQPEGHQPVRPLRDRCVNSSAYDRSPQKSGFFTRVKIVAMNKFPNLYKAILRSIKP